MQQNKEIKTELRCNKCSKKLAEGEAIKLIIKCPRCKTDNEFNNTPREEKCPSETPG